MSIWNCQCKTVVLAGLAAYQVQGTHVRVDRIPGTMRFFPEDSWTTFMGLILFRQKVQSDSSVIVSSAVSYFGSFRTSAWLQQSFKCNLDFTACSVITCTGIWGGGYPWLNWNTLLTYFQWFYAMHGSCWQYWISDLLNLTDRVWCSW